MADDTEIKQLLREIRDLLASQETKYQQHLADSKAVYAEQIAITEKGRKKSLRNILIILIVFLAGMAAIVWSH